MSNSLFRSLNLSPLVFSHVLVSVFYAILLWRYIQLSNRSIKSNLQVYVLLPSRNHLFVLLHAILWCCDRTLMLRLHIDFAMAKCCCYRNNHFVVMLYTILRCCDCNLMLWLRIDFAVAKLCCDCILVLRLKICFTTAIVDLLIERLYAIFDDRHLSLQIVFSCN